MVSCSEILRMWRRRGLRAVVEVRDAASTFCLSRSHVTGLCAALLSGGQMKVRDKVARGGVAHALQHLDNLPIVQILMPGLGGGGERYAGKVRRGVTVL